MRRGGEPVSGGDECGGAACGVDDVLAAGELFLFFFVINSFLSTVVVWEEDERLRVWDVGGV